MTAPLPPVFSTPPLPPSGASEAELLDYRMSAYARLCQVGDPGPDRSASGADPDASPGYQAAVAKLRGA